MGWVRYGPGREGVFGVALLFLEADLKLYVVRRSDLFQSVAEGSKIWKLRPRSLVVIKQRVKSANF